MNTDRSYRPRILPPPFRVVLAGIVAAFAVGAAALVLTGAPAAVAGPAEPQQPLSLLVFPNLQTAGSWIGDLVDSPMGMDGMGESVIELQNKTADPTALQFDFHSNVVSRVQSSAMIGPLGVRRFPLQEVPETEFSNYSGVLSADHAVGGVVRTTWYGGASVVHEALSPSQDLVLPLVVREVYSNSSIIYIKSLGEPGEQNKIDFELFEDDGSIRKSWTVMLEGDEALPDDLYRERVFYRDLPQNAAGGFIGAWHVSAAEPVAIAIYGDEPVGVGSYALVAKPAAAAADRQYLPLVRANYLGDTIISVASVESTPIDVTVTFRGHPASTTGPSEVFRQTFRLPPRYYGTIDLGDMGRGTVGASVVPRGEGVNTGFLGSATIRATGKILVAAWEEYRESNYVLGSAAYNAFGPDDLGTSFVVPRAFMAADGQPSFLIAMNPGGDDAEVVSTVYNDDGTIWGELNPTAVPPGEMRFIALATPDYGNVRVVTRSSQPVALLVLDARPSRDRTMYAAVRMPPEVTFPTATPTVPQTPGPSPTPTPEGGTPPTPPTAPIPGDYWLYLPHASRGR